MHHPFRRLMTTAPSILALAMFGTFGMVDAAGAQTTGASAREVKPTIVLVHGAFAESSSWDGVVAKLLAEGYPVVAAANPLRGVQGDANYVAALVDSIRGSVVLVGHSYGGSVISAAATGKSNVKALVYVAGFAPDVSESAELLSSKFPGSTLGPTLAPPVTLQDGGKDLYIQHAKFHDQFAADVPGPQAARMAATQRPITEAALKEASASAAWRVIPSWFIYGTKDKNIPPAVQQFMAQRAAARRVVEVAGASHVVMVSHPEKVAVLIAEAAAGATH